MKREWLSIKDLVVELRFPSENAARCWVKRYHIPRVRRGRVILVDRYDVDHVLRHGSTVRRHPALVQRKPLAEGVA